MWLLIAFIAVPLIEIALFIQIGGMIGLIWTLAIVIVTAILGSWLLKSQGLATIGRLRKSISSLQDPTEPLAHGAMILFSGALLLTPGFFTDLVGFSLLLPGIRQRIYENIRERVTAKANAYTENLRKGSSTPGDDIIEGEFQEVPDEPPKNDGPSGWTKH
jgi:UPF0716 protein FxsA